MNLKYGVGNMREILTFDNLVPLTKEEDTIIGPKFQV